MSKRHTSKVGKFMSMACLLFVCATVQSCRDEYYYDDKEPDFLGASIYEYLEEDGNFTLFMKVIEDLGYKEILSKTGSNTLFVADDEAFRQGIEKEWGYTSYDQLSKDQKRFILFNAMLDNTYLLEMLSNSPSSDVKEPPLAGSALRRPTSASIYDSIPLFQPYELPKNNTMWDSFRKANKPIRLATDGTQTYMVHFLEAFFVKNGFENEDVQLMLNDPTATVESAYIYGNKVIKRDITCKNGYIHQLDKLLLPPSNMAEEIRKDSATQLFSRILDRFSVPVTNASLTQGYNNAHPDRDPVTVYRKRYLTDDYNTVTSADGKETVFTDLLLYDLGSNSYGSVSDMGVIFVPNTDSLEYYFRAGGGKFLVERYGKNFKEGKSLTTMSQEELWEDIDSIPNNVFQYFIRNFMKVGFTSNRPTVFEEIKNSNNNDMHIERSHLDKSIVCNNGIVYVMNKVYTPDLYASVAAPVVIGEKTSVTNKAIEKEASGKIGTGYTSYLTAMDSRFSFIVPTDDAFYYYDPVSLLSNTPYLYRFGVDSKSTSGVLMSKWEYDAQTLQPTDSISLDKNSTNIKKWMEEILNYNIVLGDFSAKQNYYMSKGYGTVKIDWDESKNETTRIYGGKELERIAQGLENENEGGRKITTTYSGSANGSTYLLGEGMIHPATNTVYDVLSDKELHPDFQEFYQLCAGGDKVRQVLEIPADDYLTIFKTEQTGQTIITSFDTYHYTVYVPTNESILKAYGMGLPQWEELDNLAEKYEYNRDNTIVELEDKKEDLEMELESLEAGSPAYTEIEAQIADIEQEIESLENENKEIIETLTAQTQLIVSFIKYHFQDNSLFIDKQRLFMEVDGKEEYEITYETSALNGTKFNEVKVASVDQPSANGEYAYTLQITGGSDENVCRVKTSGKENIDYNIMARDIVVSGNFISTSSYAVVHQIDGILLHDSFYKDGKFQLNK